MDESTAERSPREPRAKVGLRVLVVDDDSSLRASCASALANEGYDVTACGRGEEARTVLQRHAFYIALLDLHMTGVSGVDLLRECLAAHPETAVIIMTGRPDVESSVLVTELGAWEYLPKPFTATQLYILLGRARHLLEQETAVPSEGGARKRPERRGRLPAGEVAAPDLIGRAPAFLRVIQLAEQVARTDASVFLTGESGVGKEELAQFIHRRSRRRAAPMVAINCAALPETLLESEMFGHVRGAFTGAVRDKPGLLETADGGTFFLDELIEMPLPIQAKLLRVIQDGRVRRVGGEAEHARVNVRFIAATNRDPVEAIASGRLRKDLFYRLGVVPIRVPPLRERSEDIPLLAEHFLRVYWARHRDPDEPPPTFGPAAIAALRERSWSGNVRELQNLVEHTVVLLRPQQQIQPGDIPYLEEMLRETPSGPPPRSGPGEPPASLDYHAARERSIAEFEVAYLSGVMDRAGANLSRAARLAGIDRTTLYRLLQKHHIQREVTIRGTSETIRRTS